jgi:hypothetical protein
MQWGRFNCLDFLCVFLGSTGVGTQYLVLKRQAVYHLGQTAHLLFFFALVIFQLGSFCPEMAWSFSVLTYVSCIAKIAGMQHHAQLPQIVSEQVCFY